MNSEAVHKLNEALSRAQEHAPYLAMLMNRLPDVTDQLAAGALPDVSPVVDLQMPIAKALRLAKARLALILAIGDLAGILPLERVMGHLSTFADQALDLAISAAIEAHVPGAPPQGFVAIALGKHGSMELNYSSDIDPIFLFDPQTLPHRPREEPAEAAVRIGRKVLAIMQARDGDGYVFRVDLRLRPTPEVTPIVIPVGAAISYYESQAVAWERAAFIRARSCAGDAALGQRFLDVIHPFIWRRGLDFGAIQEIRGMSHRIRDHHRKGQNFGPGYDLKRGRGGIREIEFYTQIHQLIHGGRDRALRSPATLDALDVLSAADRIDLAEANMLKTAYRLHRTIEHRLQMVNDLQTHMIPVASDDLDQVALLHGVRHGAALLDLLRPHVEAVGALYDGLDGERPTAIAVDVDGIHDQLRAAGFGDTKSAVAQIGHWRSGAVRALRTSAALEALEGVLPRLLSAIGAAPDPQAAITRFSNLIERLPSAINLFRLLDARPALLALLVDIVSHAPVLAEQLARRTELLDQLVDATALDPVGSVADIARLLRDDGDLERQLDHARRVVGELRFALGVQVIEGTVDPIEVAAGYARVAEAAVHVVVDAVVSEFQRSHGRVPGSELVILALGRLGGGELTHASDLDLIYLFNGDFSAESDGPKPLGAVQYYNRLAQRVTAGLSVPTAAGPLYEIDTRLRPSGAKGPLSVSLEGFRRYQEDEAWTWEHMALARARSVYGSATARAEAEAIVTGVLRRPRDVQKLRCDAAKMRSDMAQHKPPKGPLDVKLAEGGLVDLEFCVHVVQLKSGIGLNPQLSHAIAALSKAGLLPVDMLDAHRLLTRFLVTARLVAPDLNVPDEATRILFARACGADHWDALLADLDQTRQRVAATWQRIKGE